MKTNTVGLPFPRMPSFAHAGTGTMIPAAAGMDTFSVGADGVVPGTPAGAARFPLCLFFSGPGKIPGDSSGSTRTPAGRSSGPAGLPPSTGISPGREDMPIESATLIGLIEGLIANGDYTGAAALWKESVTKMIRTFEPDVGMDVYRFYLNHKDAKVMSSVDANFFVSQLEQTLLAEAEAGKSEENFAQASDSYWALALWRDQVGEGREYYSLAAELAETAGDLITAEQRWLGAAEKYRRDSYFADERLIAVYYRKLAAVRLKLGNRAGALKAYTQSLTWRPVDNLRLLKKWIFKK